MTWCLFSKPNGIATTHGWVRHERVSNQPSVYLIVVIDMDPLTILFVVIEEGIIVSNDCNTIQSFFLVS